MSRNRVFEMQSPTEMNANPQILEESSPHSFNFQCRDQIKSAKSDSKKQNIQTIENMTINSQQQYQNVRKQQHILIYFLNLIITFCISFQNILLVFTTNQQSKGVMSIIVAFCTVCISMLSTYRLSKDKWKIFNLYILLDDIFLTEVASCFGFIGFLLLISDGYWYQIITMLAFPLQIIFFVGNFRIMMLQVRWSKWRIILFKLVLLADSAVFFQIGAYYMSNNYLYTAGVDTVLDGKIKDFVLLYIFGLFALFVELYKKVCDADQTSQLKFTYQFKEMQEQKKIEKIMNTVNNLNQQVEKNRSRFMSELQKKSYIDIQEMPVI